MVAWMFLPKPFRPFAASEAADAEKNNGLSTLRSTEAVWGPIRLRARWVDRISTIAPKSTSRIILSESWRNFQRQAVLARARAPD
jgi:hypothetical protein